jgi:hypothetical protein
MRKKSSEIESVEYLYFVPVQVQGTLPNSNATNLDPKASILDHASSFIPFSPRYLVPGTSTFSLNGNNIQLHITLMSKGNEDTSFLLGLIPPNPCKPEQVARCFDGSELPTNKLLRDPVDLTEFDHNNLPSCYMV